MDQAASAPAETPLVAMRGIVKTFGSLVANDSHRHRHCAGRDPRAARRERRGQVDAREDAVRPAAAQLRARSAGSGERRRRCPTRGRARRLGIGMVFQHFSLFDDLTVAENVALALDGDEPRHDLADAARAARRSATACRSIPSREVWTLSVGERQRIEIVRCLLQDPQAAHPRRADLGAHAAGGRHALRDAGAAARRKAARILYITPQARGGEAALRHAPPSCAHGKVVGRLRSARGERCRRSRA